MVAKTSRDTDTARVAEHLEALMSSHREYFSSWRSEKFTPVQQQADRLSTLETRRSPDRDEDH